MKTIATAFAALLLAGASTAALAQDRDHGDRGDRGERGQAHDRAQAPQGGQPHVAAPVGPQSAPPAAQQSAPPQRSFERHGYRDGSRFQGANPVAPPVPQPQPQPRFDRGGPSGVMQRPYERERGPREVVPPTADTRQFDRRDSARDWRDTRRDGDRRDGARDWRDTRGDGDRRDGANPWRRGDRWEAGRAPPVFWSHDRYRVGRYRAPYGFYARSWAFGDFLPRGWYGPDYLIDDFFDYGLPYPPPGYEWVRVGEDALMIDRFTGRIVQVVRGIFW